MDLVKNKGGVMVQVENTQKALTVLALILATVFVGRSALADSSAQNIQVQTAVTLENR